MATSNTEQIAFRGRNDDGSETTATWIAAQNTNWTQAVGNNFRVRFEIEEDGGKAFTLDGRLQYNKNAAGWNNVNGTSANVRAFASPNIADGVATTNQLTASALTFVAGSIDEVDGATAAVSLTSQHTELEFVLQIVSADVAHGDTIELRITDAGTALNVYTATPSITVSKVAAALGGVGTLAGAAAVSVPVPTGAGGVGTLAVNLEVQSALITIAAGLGGVGTLAGAAAVSVPIAAGLGGVGTLAGAAAASVPVAAGLGGVGTLAGAAAVSSPIAAALGGVGTLGVALAVPEIVTIAAGLGIVGTLAGAAAASVPVAAGLGAIGTLAVSIPSRRIATYVLEVDWDNSGTFDGGTEDVTAFCRGVRYVRGRDYASQLTGRAVAGELVATLLNTDGRFNSFLAAGPMFGNILPGRRVRLRSTVPGPYTLWYGFLDTILPEPRHGALDTATLRAIGPLGLLNQREVVVAPSTGVLTGAAIGTVLDDAGWATSTNSRTIDAGRTTMNRWWADRKLTLTALREIEETEGGYIGESPDGKIVWEDRLHRMTSPHTVSQVTLTDAATGSYRYERINQADPLREVYNAFEANVRQFTVGALAVLWTHAETGASSPTLVPGQTRTFWANFPNPDSVTDAVMVDAWTTPVATTDYTANSASDGSGTNLTADIGVVVTKFAKAMKIELTNNHATLTAFVTLLQARGTPVTQSDPTRIRQESTASFAKYGRRTFTNAAPWIPNSTEAANWAGFNLGIYAEPLPILSVGVLANRSSGQLTQVLTRDISDRITLVATSTDTNLGANQEFFIETMHHEIDQAGIHRARYAVSPASGYSGFWILGTSKLGSETKLGWG